MNSIDAAVVLFIFVTKANFFWGGNLSQLNDGEESETIVMKHVGHEPSLRLS